MTKVAASVDAVYKLVKNPNYRIRVFDKFGLYDHMPDEEYLKKMFLAWVGYPLNLDNPRTFNEKMQWLKIHDRKDIYSTMVDKCLAKDYVSKKIGNDVIIPSLCIWDDVKDVDFDKLPNQFVIKCNHNSGLGMCICTDKTKANKQQIKINLSKGLRQDYYLKGREWPYKNIRRRILAEKYMVDESKKELKDYKVFCFNGKPEFIQVDFGRFSVHERKVYSTKWECLGFSSLYPPNTSREIDRPTCLRRMLEISEELSKGIPFIRVDMYVIDNRVYFGEMTLYHGSGFEPFYPDGWDLKLGDLLDLSRVDS